MNYLKPLISIILFLPPSLAGAEKLNLSHDKCVEMAIENSENVKVSENSLSRAVLNRKIAGTAYLPKVEGSATGLYMLPDIDMMGAKMKLHGAYVAGLQLTQPIYAGGKIAAGRNLAKIGHEAAEQQVRLSRAEVIAEADHAYWTYVAVCSKAKMMEQYIRMIDTLYQQTDVAVKAGMATGNELLRIMAKRSEIIYQREKVNNGAELCRMALCNIIGVEMDTPLSATDSIPSVADPAMPATGIDDRPELHLLHLQVEAAEQQVKMTRGDFSPTVGLSLGYNYYGNIKTEGMMDAGGGNYVPYTKESRDKQGMCMVGVKIPLFHWSEGTKSIKKAKYEVENSMLNLERNKKLLTLEANQAAINLIDGRNMVSTAETALSQAKENLRVMQNRYDEGMTSLTDILDAQTQWQQAKSNHIEALTQYQIYKTAWLKANGKL